MELTNTIKADLGKWEWTTPDIYSESCRIKVVSKFSTALYSESDSSFSIIPQPRLRIFEENGIASVGYLSKQIKFTYDSKYLISSDGYNTNIWDVEIGNLIYTINEQFVDANGSKYAIVTADSGTWDYHSVWYYIPPIKQSSTARGYFWRQWNSKITTDGKFISTAYYDGWLRLWNLKNNQIVWTRQSGVPHEDHFHFINISQDDEIIASFGAQPTVFYDLKSGDVRLESEVSADRLSFSPMGDKYALIRVLENRIIEVYHRVSGVLFSSFTGHPEKINFFEFSPDGKYIIFSTNDDVRIWDVEQNQLNSIIFEAENAKFRGVVYSPDGRYIASKKHESDIWVYGPINN